MGADGDARRDGKGGRKEGGKEEESGLRMRTGWLLVESTP